MRSSGAKLFLVIVCGFEDAIAKIEALGRELLLPLRVFCSDRISDSDKAFHPGATVFETDYDRGQALQIAREKGEALEKKWPLGHGDCQSLVIFFSNCPNNTLPIFYKAASDWKPLFVRR